MRAMVDAEDNLSPQARDFCTTPQHPLVEQATPATRPTPYAPVSESRNWDRAGSIVNKLCEVATASRTLSATFDTCAAEIYHQTCCIQTETTTSYAFSSSADGTWNISGAPTDYGK